MTAHMDGPLYYEQLGKSGRPMIFVHSSPLDHSCWIYQMDHFSTWYRCFSVDLPGYGKSAKAQPGLTIADLAAACWEVLDEVAPSEPAIVVGESVGWHVVMHMANQQPARTSAIIMSGCAYRATPSPGPDNIPDFVEHGMGAREPKIVGLYSPAFRGTDTARYFTRSFVERNGFGDAQSIVEVLRALGPHPRDPEWLFEGAKAPALIITGSEDGAHEGAFTLQKKIPGCELVTIDGAGHACNMEKPWEWDAQAQQFLARHGLFPGEGVELTTGRQA